MTKNLQPIRGFRDLYPEDKAVQNYIFDKLKQTAKLFGFEEYEGPILEPIEMYLNKTSQELIDRQTFQIKTKKDETLVMRPEMTPSLARMIAKKEHELIFPLRLFNLGLRFRYEAPQKGRAREFYQADFDILGTDSILADGEIINAAVNIFLRFGATDKDFMLYINSRITMQKQLMKFGILEKSIKQVIAIIDKKEKVTEETFAQLLINKNISQESIAKIMAFLKQPKEYEVGFGDLLSLLEAYGIRQYIKVNPSIVRGLDYYTGLVFEVKEKGNMTRSLLGGGRYDNLVGNFGASRKIPGVGFAVSDVVLWEFLKDKNLIPELQTKTTKVLVTVFPEKNIDPRPLQKSIEISNILRRNQIPAELYLETDRKLDKQLKYADKNNIPYVVIVGPEEIKNNTVKVKNMKTGEQKNTSLEQLLPILSQLKQFTL